MQLELSELKKTAQHLTDNNLDLSSLKKDSIALLSKFGGKLETNAPDSLSKLISEYTNKLTSSNNIAIKDIVIKVDEDMYEVMSVKIGNLSHLQ